MELVMVRHALPVRHRGTDGTGPDPGLSPDGRAQTERLADYLATERFDAIYSSPLRRAVETAVPIAARQELEVALVDAIAEWEDGTGEYVPIEELKATGDPRWETYRDGSLIEAAAEPWESFCSRVVTAIDELVATHPSQRIAVVCHGMVINAYLADVIGLSISTAFFYPNYTSIHRVAAARSGERSIVTLNETGHLRGSGLPIGLFQR